MPKNEKTSKRVAEIASKALRAPSTLTNAEIKILGGSALTQAPDKPKRKPAKKTPPKKTTAKKKSPAKKKP